MMIEGLKGASLRMKKNRDVEIKKKTNHSKRKYKKSKINIFLMIAVSVFAVYVIAVFVGQQIEISGKKEKLASVTQELQVQEIKNNEIKKSLESNAGVNSEYIERLARVGLDFVKPSERVFVNVAGN